MRAVALPIVGGSHEAIAKTISAERLINWRHELGPRGRCLVGTPGLVERLNLSHGPVLALHEMNDVLYAVAGNRAFRIFSDHTYQDIGHVAIHAGRRVVMADDGTNVMILNGGPEGYAILNGTTLTQITDADFSGGETLTWQDGYFILTEVGTIFFRLFDLFSATSTLTSDFARPIAQPDPVRAVKSDHHEVWVLKKKTGEVWINTGDAQFPLERMQAGNMERGIVAPHTLAKFDNSLTWLSQDKRGAGQVVQASNGYTPVVISPPDITQRIRKLSRIDDAFAYSFQHDGHEFYVLTFPTGNLTLCYDAGMKEWHEWSSALNGSLWTRHRSNCHAFAFGRHYVGDIASGKVMTIEPDTYTELGARIRRDRITENVTDKEQDFSLGRVRVVFNAGVVEQGLDPVASLQWSKDSGNTFSNEQWRSVGKVGEYDAQATWSKLGVCRRIAFWLAVDAPINWCVTDAFGEIR